MGMVKRTHRSVRKLYNNTIEANGTLAGAGDHWTDVGPNFFTLETVKEH